MSLPRLNNLPNRRVFEHRKLPPEAHVDAHGLLTSEGVRITRGVEALLDLPLALIVAPPWYGKTFVAKGLESYLTAPPQDPGDAPASQLYVRRTSFHEFGRASAIEPAWWDQWKREEKTRAYWIIDAVDEDWHSRNKYVLGILERIAALERATRSRLSLILFCRENEVPDGVRSELDALSETGRVDVHALAPPDEREAARIAWPQDLETVRQIIADNDLGRLGGYPDVIKQLAKRSPSDRISRNELWAGVLRDRLRGGHRERQDVETLPDVADRFDAAKRAAAVSLFAGLPELDTGSGDSSIPAAINTLFSKEISCFDRLQQAAHSLRHTDLLTQTATGYRFKERHVQEWFAAFALDRLPLARLRPLVSKDDNPLPHLRGAMPILREVSQHKEVRTWITQIHGGLPPPSDTLPWELEDAIKRLDRLEELARRSPYGLTLWDPSGLEHLAVTGIARELSARLKDARRTSREKILLLDIVEAVGATDVLPVVEQIIQDPDNDDRLRSDASYTLVRLGSTSHFTNLIPFVQEVTPTTREQCVVVSNVIRGLLKHAQWGFREAYEYAPSPDQGIGDASSVVEHELTERMTLEDARWLLKDFDWENQSHRDLRDTPGLRVYQKRHGALSFARHAVRLLLEQDSIDQADWNLLHAVVFARDDGAIFDDLAQEIIGRVEPHAHARRTLVEVGLRGDPSGKRNWGWRWRWVLTTDDADWLAQLAEREGAKSPWLWTDLLRLTNDPAVDDPTRQSIRNRVRTHQLQLLADFDRQCEEDVKQQQQHKEELERCAKEQEQQQWQLTDVVQQILSAEDLTQEHKLHKLSWVSFPEDGFRPDNVIGRFDELALDLQRQVVATCVDALSKVEPTPVPDGGPYPATILYEAEAFAAALHRTPDYQLDRGQIRKWLPAVLCSSSAGAADVLARCFDTDRATTEGVFVGEIRREIRARDEGSLHAANLPVEFWSASLVEKALATVHDESLRVQGRCNLLRVIAARSPKAADATARRWLHRPEAAPSDKNAFRLAAIDALLLCDPLTGTVELSKAVTDLGGDVLKQVDAISWRPGADAVTLKSWPPAALEALTSLLYEAYPVRDDPEKIMGEAHWVGPIDDLRRLRDALPLVLFERGASKDVAALERLSAQFPAVRKWYDSTKANREAIDFIQTGPATENNISWKEVIRILDDAEYRLIHNSADLQRVLLEQIHEIANTVKQHLAMLYRSGTKPRKRQYEDALRAYIHARLSDRLKGRVLGQTTCVILNRETQEAADKKFDIKVQAPTIDGEAATVVIEVKWSDNPEVSTSLREQLGQRYLLANHFTHGIYLVGWNEPGKWKDSRIDAPTDLNCLQTWKAAFQRQSDAFTSKHPEIHITPTVIDLRWELA